MAAKNTGTAKHNIATRFFKDAGTGKSFEAGKPVEVDDDTLANYTAAGLIDAPSAAQQLVDEANGTA
ncbi:hypothetical protein [Sphingomonas sp. 2SG]|jgi:hypothetical protein|uniref:hypothetical protein n=1 Tax=Sphingomonas sp. 2SG TaxID=2502201 RepID=UPI0010F9954A|nr:hypothetical protein [Sphingomonas sp. 2SG]